MTDAEKLFIALLSEEDDDELFTMLEIVALLHELGVEYRALREKVLAAA